MSAEHEEFILKEAKAEYASRCEGVEQGRSEGIHRTSYLARTGLSWPGSDLLRFLWVITDW